MTRDASTQGWRAKIDRADESINNLKLEFERFLQINQEHYRGVIERNDDTREFILRAFGEPLEVPPRLQVLAGEILHHLRTSLDHIVWALALKKISNPSARIQFPICDSVAKFEKACKDGMIRGISGPAAHAIERAQPFHSPEPRDHALFVLNRLSNIDKHRLLLVAYGAVSSAGQIAIDPGAKAVAIAGISPPKFVLPTKDGAEVCRVTFTELNPNTKVDFKSPAVVVFKEFGISPLEAVIPGLLKLRDAVTNTLSPLEREL